MNFPSDWIAQNWNISEETQLNLLYTVIVFIVLLILRIASIKIFTRNIHEAKDRYYWSRAIRYTFGVTFLLAIVVIWLSEIQSVATFLGLVSAALTIALKDLVVNMAGWMFILIRKPFGVGDRIAVGEHQGDVIDVRIFQFTINEIGNWVDADQSTGRIIHIPNGKVFTEPQANYTQGFSHIWNEIGVMITFESNWEKAKEKLSEIVNRHAASFSKSAEQRLIEASKKYMILYNKLTPIVYTSVKDSGVMLTMRYLITPRRRRSSEEAIWEDVLRLVGENKDINLAYPTQRIYYAPEEDDGKTRPQT